MTTRPAIIRPSGAWTEYQPTNTSTALTKTLNLTNGKIWRLRVRAGNAVVDGAWSWPVAEVVVGSPAPVAAPTLTSLSGGQVRVAWTAPATNGSALTGYSLWHRQGTGNWTEVTGIAGSATSHTLTLTAGQTYAIGVEARNARGGSNPSATEFGGATSSATLGVPLAASAVKETTATLTIADWTSAWYYKGNQAGAQCKAVAANTTTATLTGLTGGTNYTYKAYSDSGCATEITAASTDAEFSTVGLTATSVTATGATLNLANWTSAWYYKGNQTNAACTSVAANTATAGLTGLTGGTSYIYTVYSASGCGAAAKIADAEFATTGLSVNITGVPAMTNSVFTATFTFSAAVTGFDMTDIKLGNATSANFAGSGTTYTADITPTGESRRRPGQPRGPSVYSVWVAANAAVDANNVGNGAAIRRSGTYDASPTLAIEGVPATNNGTAFTARFAFSEAVTGFEASDVSLTGATMTGFSGSGAVYSGSVTATADYTISVAAGAAQDGTGNDTPASSSSGTFDDTAPTVAITGVPAAANGAFTATFTFSEPVTGFATTDTIDATVTGAAVSEIAGVGDGSVYTALITPTADYAVAVAADVAQDAAGNNNTASESASGVYDTTAPTVAITGVPATTSGAFTATFTFSESVTGFEVGDITLSNATASNFSGSAATYTATVSPDSNGAYSVAVPADAARDAATNGNTASATASGTASSSVCSRTAQVRDAIVAAVTGKTTCSAITDADLAGITTLSVEDNATLTALQAGDFAGLTALTTLDLDDNGLTSLPANIFDELTALTHLDLRENSLTSLPANIFDNLTKLTNLELSDNSLSSLRSGVFDNLTALTYLGLYQNSLTVLPANIFDKLTKLTGLDLGNNSLTSSTLPDGVFDNLTKLETLWIGGNSGLATLPAGIFDNLASLTQIFALGSTQLTCLPFIPNNAIVTYAIEPGAAACGAAVTVGATAVTVGAGQTATYTVALDAYPRGNVTVTPASGAAGTATVSGALTFTTDNWSTAQSVTVTGVAAGSATVSHTVAGGGYGSATAANVAATVTAASLAASAVTQTTATLTLTGHTGNWYYKYTAPSSGACSAAQTGTTASLTTLTGGTAYTFKAYSDSACTTLVAAAGAFTTLDLTASAVTQTTATLTLSGHTGNWYHKKTSPIPAGSCSTAQSGTAASLTTLTGGTAYTWKAYSDSGCATEIASESFTTAAATAPPAPTGLAATPGNTSAALSWTSGGNGGAAITKWQYRYKTTAGYGAWSDICATTSDATCPTKTSYTVTGLTNGAAHTFQVRAVNSAGNGAESPASGAVTPAPAGQPGKPEMIPFISGTGNFGAYFLVRWTHPANGASNYYEVRTADEQLTQTGYPGSATEVKFLRGSDTLRRGFNWTLKVRGHTTDLGGVFGPWSYTTTARAALPTATAGNIGTTGATLTVGNLPARWWYQGDQAGATCTAVPNGTTTANLAGLDAGTEYTYNIYYRDTCTEDSDKAAHWDVKATFTTATATLAASNVKETEATLTIAGHTAAWWYQGNQTGATCIAVAANTATASLTGLTGGTSYTYKAYSDMACATEITTASTDAEFSTVGLTAGSVTSSGATLTLANWTSAWHYKGNQTNASCTSVAANTNTATLTGLDALTDFTYSVYSAAGCASADEIADVAFTTSSGATLDASAITETTATLTLGGTWTGNWYHKQADPAGGTCSAAVTGTTANLTNLTGGTQYAWQAYSDAGCATAIATTFFSTVGLTANPTSTGATLTLAYWPSAWWHNKTSGPGTASCTSVAAKHQDGHPVGPGHGLELHLDGVQRGELQRRGQDRGRGLHHLDGVARGRRRQGNHRHADHLRPHRQLVLQENIARSGRQLLHGPDRDHRRPVRTDRRRGLHLQGVQRQRLRHRIDDRLDRRGVLHGRVDRGLGDTDHGDADPVQLDHGLVAQADVPRGRHLRLRGRQHRDRGPRRADGELRLHLDGLQRRRLQRYGQDRRRGFTTSALSLAAPTLSAPDAGTARQISLSWSHPTGVSGLGAYRVRYREKGQDTWTYADASSNSGEQNYAGSATSATIPANESFTMKDNTIYEVEVRAGKWNGGYDGWGAWTDTAEATTLPGKPTKPVAASGGGSGTLTLTASVTGNGAITKWQYVKKEGSGVFETTWTDISSTAASLNHDVTGLTDGTNYQFKVRAVNAAGNGADSDASGAASPANVMLTASSVEDDTATLTIANHTGDWYYKYTTPTGGDCSSSAVTGTAASLTDLSTNTDYTYKAYSDSGCTTELATETLLTKPGQPTGLAAAAGAGSGKLTLTASVTGDGAITKWQYRYKTTGDYGNWQDVSLHFDVAERHGVRPDRRHQSHLQGAGGERRGQQR